MKYALIGFAAALIVGATAHAADLYQQEAPPQPYYEPQQPAVSSAGGWYLRGDGFYSFNKLRGANFYQGGSSASLVDFTTASVENSYGLGAGVGYQINSMLRADLTADYMFASNFKGSTTGNCGTVGFSPCTSKDLATVSALSILANAYVDLGTYYSITPYVGAGIGGTRINWSNLTNTACSNANSANCDPSVTHDGKASWRFTYALMAGAAVDVTCNIKADAGYRYRHVDGGEMFGYKSNGGPGYDKGFDIHEGRVGLRYTFGGCAQPAPEYIPPMAPPAVYK